MRYAELCAGMGGLGLAVEEAFPGAELAWYSEFEDADVYSETFTTSGTTRNGVAYALPTWEHRTEGSASSSSPGDVELLMTPVAKEGEKATFQQGSAQKAKTGQVRLTNQVRDIYDLNLLPTTTAMDYKASGGAEGSSNVTLTDAIVRGRGLLPTPRTSDTNGPGLHGDGGMDLRTTVTMLPTPRATRGGSGTETMRDATDWGPYAPAIARWEAVLGRPAPAPTKPNAKGNHRLSPRFCEWLMGVPEGWICDTPGVSRNEQLKAAGNGVVPQQAAAALRDMLFSFEAQDREGAA